MMLKKTGRVDLSQYNNDNFSTGAGGFKVILWYLINILFFQNPLNVSCALKVVILRLFGAEVGTGVVIKPSISIKYPWRLSIGDYSWIGEGVWIDNLVSVKIGSNCCLSQGAMLLTGNHNYKKDTFDLMVGEIIMGDGSWIGAKSVVCPGVNVGFQAILTVGSVAADDLLPDTIYQGNPALPKKKRIMDYSDQSQSKL